MSTAILSELLSRQEAADYIRVRPQTLAVWKTTNRHKIPVVKVGSKVFYRKSDLDKWLESRTIGGAEKE